MEVSTQLSPARRLIPDKEESVYEALHPAIAANQKGRWEILIALVITAILQVMDVSIVNVVMPQMAGSLGATMDDVTWVSTAYLLAQVVVLPMTAWLSQRFGKKTFLSTCIIVFTVSRLLVAFSSTLGLVILWRLVQGAAGAALVATGQTVLAEIFPPEKQGMVQALFGIGLVVTPATAPLIGGLIVDNFSWQTVFYIHVPVAILAYYLFSTLYTDNSTESTRAAAGKIDGLGIVLLAIGLGSLQYVLEEGERYDWFGDVWITRFAVIAVLGMIALIYWQLSPANKAPVVNLRIYAKRGLWSAVIISLVVGVGMYGVAYAFTVFVMRVLGFSPTTAGLALGPGGLGALCSLVIVAAVSHFVDVRIQAAVALALAALGSWMLGFNTQVTGIEHTSLPMFLVGFGCAGGVIPVISAGLAAVKESEAGDAAGQMALGRQLGGSFGIAILNTYIQQMFFFHRSRIYERLSFTNQTLTREAYGVIRLASANGYHGRFAQSAALDIISRLSMRQALIKANNSAFQLISLMFVSSIFLVSLLKAPKVGMLGGVESADQGS